MKTYHFAAVIEKDADGYYAFCPELQGCYTSGDFFEEARANLADAIRLHIEDRLARGEEISSSSESNWFPAGWPAVSGTMQRCQYRTSVSVNFS